MEKHAIIDWTCRWSKKEMSEKIRSKGLLINDIRKLDLPRETCLKFYGGRCRRRFTQPFLVYLVTDPDPTYDYRDAYSGRKSVNVKTWDLKNEMRQSVDGNPTWIHATDDEGETKFHLGVLGISLDFPKSFKDLRDMFSHLDSCGVNYIVQRNFDEVLLMSPEDIADVDILTDDYQKFIGSIESTPSGRPRVMHENGGSCIQHRVNINGVKLRLDIRYVGDNYYCQPWEKSMLESKVFHKEGGFWMPEDEDFIYSLLYHAHVHKKQVAKKYLNIFDKRGLSKTDLDKWMKEKGYSYVKPKDVNVGYFI